MKGLVSILLPDMRCGGAERVAVNLANSLVGRGYGVDMVLLQATGELLDDLKPQVRTVDLNVSRMRFALPAFVRYLRRTKPEALLACMWPLTALSIWARMLAADSSRIRVVVAEHTTWSRDEIASTPFGRWKVITTMRLSFPFADAIVTVSEGAAEDLGRFTRMAREAITVVYNPVVGAPSSPSSEALPPHGWWTGAHRRVLAVGSLKAIKDYMTLLEAFSIVRLESDVRLLILGEGDCRQMLEKRVSELGLEERVFMPGFVRDPSPYYQHADLFVLSSTGEGLPTVIIEALSAGTPVVSTDCPSGPREILCDGRYGQLTPVGDATALATAMTESLGTTHERSAIKARAQDFTIEKSADQYERILFAR